MKWLVAIQEGICWCKCDRGVSTPIGDGQFDCPWCGCGWLFSCVQCRKAFTYARVVEVDTEPTALATLNVERFFHVSADKFDAGHRKAVEQQASAIAKASSTLILGTECVVLDGKLFKLKHGDAAFSTISLTFTGMYARHRLTDLPQQTFRKDQKGLIDFLGDRDYWLDRKINP